MARQTCQDCQNSANTQRKGILSFIRLNGSMTTLEARQKLGICHPGMRICELRKAGFKIETVWGNDIDSPVCDRGKDAMKKKQVDCAISVALAARLKQIGMTGKEAAAQIGVCQPIISNWLSGKVKVAGKNQDKVLYFLGRFEWSGIAGPVLVPVRVRYKKLSKTKQNRASKSQSVTKRSHPNLNWDIKPRVIWLVPELFNSDAFRELLKIESDLLLYIMSRRQYPSNKKSGKRKATARDYWNPLNGHEITIPYEAVIDFFGRKDMKRQAPCNSTITRASSRGREHIHFTPTAPVRQLNIGSRITFSVKPGCFSAYLWGVRDGHQRATD